MVDLLKVTIVTLLLASLMLGGKAANTASAQTALAAPTDLAVNNGADPGEVSLTWTAVADASYYRIGWVAYEDYQVTIAAGRDWLEAFAFVDVANRGQNSHTVTRLTPGIFYAFIVASNDSRYGAPQWSDWATLTLNTAPSTPSTPGQPTPVDGSTILVIPPPATIDCYVGLQLSPGDGCNNPDPEHPNFHFGALYVINGGDYHGRTAFIGRIGDVNISDPDSRRFARGFRSSADRSLFHYLRAEPGEGDVWIITAVNERVRPLG